MTSLPDSMESLMEISRKLRVDIPYPIQDALRVIDFDPFAFFFHSFSVNPPSDSDLSPLFCNVRACTYMRTLSRGVESRLHLLLIIVNLHLFQTSRKFIYNYTAIIV